MTTTSPPRRNWHFTRWLIVFIVAMFGWSGWRAYAFRSALAEARALGWEWYYVDPSERIRAYWKEAFKKETWLNSVSYVSIPTTEEFEQHLAIAYRLNPKVLAISSAATWRDLSLLKPLTRLQDVVLHDCTGLKNVDALKNLSALQQVLLFDCIGLTNVDALTNLPALETVVLGGCPGLKNLDALKNLSALQSVELNNCTGLTNVDALKNLSALKKVILFGCTGLTSVDGLKNLSALHEVVLIGSTGLTPETVAALKAALPNTQIIDP